VRAGVAGRQRLAEVVGRLLAHDPHLRGQVRVVLLLLRNTQAETMRMLPHHMFHQLVVSTYTQEAVSADLLGSVAAASSARTPHPSPHPPAETVLQHIYIRRQRNGSNESTRKFEVGGEKIAHMHCDIVKLADQLRRQVGVVWDVAVHLLVRRRRHL
jgi:hypothetical protein